MDTQQLRAEVAKVGWWHRIDLGGGVVTPGADNTRAKLATLRLPEDLRGKSVLDIGAWDGFFSFEAERRGASRIVAIDASWRGSDGGPTKLGFNLARRALGSRVEDMHLSVEDLDPARLGTFDVVLFLGVLYHVRHPLLSLERVRSVTSGLLVLETETDARWSRRPALAFYPEGELNGDPSNWFAPNEPALLGMLRAAGFASATVRFRTPLQHRIARAIKHRRKHGTPALHTLQRARCVAHATPA